MRQNRRIMIRGRSWPHAVMGVMWFELRAVVVTILASAVILSGFPMATPTVQAAQPKVVIIVGPVGSLTDKYRADGDRAAKAARAAGATVETIYSPNATWPLVRDALQGASLVVYLGHGNGWPSRYRKSPWPKTQNGLGLNPEAGVDDKAHQYFGESYLARDVRLAPHAVVLLNHLCYASGNSEPGLPEGDLATAQQRVDNYAAGWLAAGAEAVLAEGYGGPAYYVRRILAGEGTIESIWREAPTAHGHVLAFASVRTPGMTALMDPTKKSSGFYRSLVARAEMSADEVARGATGVTPARGDARTPSPTSASAGPTITAVTVDGVPTGGSTLRVTLTVDKAGKKPVPGLGIGIRWDPIALDPPPVIPAGSASPATPAASPPDPSASPATPPAERGPAPSASPAASSEAGASPIAETGGLPSAPPIVLISPEVPGAVVDLSEVKVTRSSISAELVTPIEPGLYRLSVSIHDGDGVAFDARTQERIPALTVRVTGELSAVVSVADRLRVTAGATVDLPVTVANTGHVAWVFREARQSFAGALTMPAPGERDSALVGQWMRLDGSGTASDAVAAETVAARATIEPLPGATEDVVLAVTAPPEPGNYLLVLDVVSPLYGSLTAVGGSPVVVRVEVVPPESGGTQGGGQAGGPKSSR